MVVENKHTRKAELKEDVTKIQLNPRLPDSQSRKGDTNKKFGKHGFRGLNYFDIHLGTAGK